MKTFCRIVGICLLVLNFTGSFGQKLPITQINIPTPNAGSLGLYGEVPVSLFTGTPNINVPVYQIKEGNFTIPLSLSYHYSGLHPDIPPGWVGNGWSLMAGGAITRVVKTAPDELATNDPNSPNPKQGFYYNTNYLQDPNWETTTSLNNYFHGSAGLLNAPIANHELAPDEFNFNFLGISGSFYLDETGKWKVRSERDIKVTFNGSFVFPFIYNPNFVPAFNQSNPVTKTFQSFTLTDEDGTQYVFGENEAIEYSENWIDQILNTSFTATSWYLTSIILPNGKTITFKYDRGPFIPQLDLYYTYAQKYSSGSTGISSYFSLDVPCGQDAFDAAFNGKWVYSAKLLSPIYLSSIETSSSIINFKTTASNAKYYTLSQYNLAIRSITQGAPIFPSQYLSDNNYIFTLLLRLNEQYQDFGIPYYAQNSAVLKANLGPNDDPMTYYARRFVWLKLSDITVTSKFNNSTIYKYHLNYDETSRLKLKDFQNLDNSGSLVNHYHFDYNPLALPEYLVDQTDHWGYYNNVHQPSSYNTYTTQKNPSNNSFAEILDKITYPTGGSSQFVPELHQYSSLIDVNNPSAAPTSSSGFAGGVRIKKIINDDGFGHIMTSNYYYVKGYTSLTDPATLPSSGELSGIPIYTYSNLNGIADDGHSYTYSVFNTQPVIPASQNSAGSYIGYSNVVEQRSDGSYTISNFTNYSSGTAFRDANASAVLNGTQYPFLPLNDNSELRGKLLSVQNFNSLGKIVASKTYSNFQTIPSSINYIRSVTGIPEQICGTHWLFIASANRKYLYNYVPTQLTERLYKPDGNYVEQITSSVYDSQYRKVNSKTVSTSGNNSLNYTYTYPFSSSGAVYQAMVQRNILAPMVSQQISRGSAPVEFKQFNYKQWDDFNFLPQSMDSKVAGNNIDRRMEFLMYDANGNIKSTSQENGVVMSYEWGYNNNYPVVQIKNAINNITQGPLAQQTALIGYSNEKGDGVFVVNTDPQVTLFTTGVDNGSVTITAGNGNFISLNGGHIDITGTLTGPGGYSKNIALSVTDVNPSAAITITGLVAGTYSLTSSAGFYTIANTSYIADLSILYPTNTTTVGTKEFYYEGFEESLAGVSGQAHTGRKYGTNNTVSWPIPATGRTYKISYWYLSGGVWKYSGEQNYQGPSFIMQSAGAYDDIRIYPVDAEMTTYTYDPLVGVTSSTDPKGETIYYEYDSFQRLMDVKDKDRNIVRHMNYHYQGQ